MGWGRRWARESTEGREIQPVFEFFFGPGNGKNCTRYSSCNGGGIQILGEAWPPLIIIFSPFKRFFFFFFENPLLNDEFMILMSIAYSNV